LAEKGCTFTFDLQAKTKILQGKAVGWRPEYASRAAESREVRGGSVRRETQYAPLLHEPLSFILSSAIALSGKAENFLVEKDPFAGLCIDRPVLAFRALSNAANRDDYPEWAWQTFLCSESRKNDKFKFSALIAERLSD
jgi:hypothetical protein